VRCEIVFTPDLNRNGRRILRAMTLAAPIRAVEVAKPTGLADLLMVYGVGEPTRRAWFYDHVAKGRHAIGWDLGYWGRDWNGVGNMRVTIDADHPQKWIRDMPSDRFDDQGMALRDDHDPDGHIVLVGLGRKQVRAMKGGHLGWERSMLAKIRQVYPDRTIVFRPKKDPMAMLPGCLVAGTGPIDNLLRGASLVVCHHSNVAVDACLAGVPVFCEDGAAAALYAGNLSTPTNPTPAERLAFLRNLAWWQWSRHEAAQAWAFLLDTIKGAN
jgi:hypothetical protein